LFARDYRVVRPLSQGGMGSVYVVEQVSTGRERALKLMHPFLVRDPKLRQRFEQEAKVGALIESAHVVEIVGAGVDEATGIPWLCMELLRGQDLAAVVDEQGVMAPAVVLLIFEQLCHALGAAHAASIVHRDLKPENVFLASSRQAGVPFMVKVLDFGIAKVVAEGRKSDTSAIGSPLWMAPEQTVTGGAVSQRTDVWALGLIAFKLLTGRSYWRGAHDETASALTLLREIVMEPLVTASQRASELAAPLPPVGFDAWFARCVAREPSDRFADAPEAFAALAPVLGGAAPAPSVALPPGMAASVSPSRATPRTMPDAGAPRTVPDATPQGFEKTEVAEPADDAGDAIPGLPSRAAAKRRGVAFTAVAAIGSLALAGVGVSRIFATADERATRTIASAEASITRREEASALAEQQKKLLGQRLALDRVFGKMIAVPAATLDVGADDLGNDERPVHKEAIAAFEIDPTEVSVGAYQRCIDAGSCGAPQAGPRCNAGKPDHPVNCVDAAQASAFCQWIGKRLPTELEWELAARGKDGRPYPWGTTPPGSEPCWRRFDKQLKRGDGTCVVGAHPQGDSPFGAKDMAGNVREWTSSAYCPYSRKDCGNSAIIVRGGAWTDDDPLALRAAAREHRAADQAGDDLGFRCARAAL
jgi:formylglycine-generating enzyme required for sulfatase activity/tRNA A-37 threonylcarbamoyl transferase component Bud32